MESSGMSHTTCEEGRIKCKQHSYFEAVEVTRRQNPVDGKVPFIRILCAWPFFLVKLFEDLATKCDIARTYRRLLLVKFLLHKHSVINVKQGNSPHGSANFFGLQSRDLSNFETGTGISTSVSGAGTGTEKFRVERPNVFLVAEADQERTSYANINTGQGR